MDKMEIKAFAKINLDFKILDRLPNGYHKIHSIFQAIDIYDTISIFKEERNFYLTGSVVCLQQENLISKAKEVLESFIGKKLPCRVHLIKNIPVSAGLGGGSSDAAAILMALNKLYKLNLNLKQLVKIGLEVGSDVPFFTSNIGTALVEGIGEKIKPIQKQPSPFYVLARLHKRINTSEMYALFDKQGGTFLKLAQKICPDIKKIYSHFSPISNECGISGSGPTIFAGFNFYNDALKGIEEFGFKRFDGDFFICRPSSRTYIIQ